MKSLCGGNNNNRDMGTLSMESLRAYIEKKFEALTLEMQRGQGDSVNLILQLQGQVASLETQVQQKLNQHSARGNHSARARSQDQLAQVNPAFAMEAKETNGISGAHEPHAELVPLLAENDPDHRGSQPLSSPKEGEVPADMSFHDRLKYAKDSMQAGKVELPYTVKLVTTFLEDPESSPAALLYSQFILCFSVLAICVGLLPYVGLMIPVYLEVCIDGVLCSEVIVRCMFCPNFFAFLMDGANLIDAASAIPLSVIFLMYCDLYPENWGNAILLSAVPVIRFLRLVRRFPRMQILISAFKDCLEALPVLMYTLAVMGCVFTSALYLLEPRDHIETVSECAWLVISTISTVGYGDITPCTKWGSAVASLLMVVSQLYMAMPFGIIGYNFTIIWEHRASILLLNSTRDRLAKWGFGAYEIPRLFELFDLDESAEFDMQEFLLLFKEMDIGFKDDEVIELFKLIDKDAGGSIDEKEFVKTVYPDEYRNMYTMKNKDAVGGKDTSDSQQF